MNHLARALASRRQWQVDNSRKFISLAIVCLALVSPALLVAQEGPGFAVSFAPGVSAEPIDGRVLLLLSNNPTEEPRMQINDTPKTQMVFGMTVDGLKPGTPVTVDSTARGYPVRRLKDVPPGAEERWGNPFPTTANRLDCRVLNDLLDAVCDPRASLL